MYKHVSNDKPPLTLFVFLLKALDLPVCVYVCGVCVCVCGVCVCVCGGELKLNFSSIVLQCV